MKNVPYYTYCSAPWEEFVLHADLSYSPCCFGPKVGKITSVDEIDQVWNGEVIRKIRHDLLNGIKNPMCEGCALFNVIHNRPVIEVADDWQPKYQTVESAAIQRLNILITEKCNLKCIMCNSTDVYPNRMTDGPSIPFEFIQRLGEKYFDGLDFLNPNCFGEFFVYEGFNQYLDLVEKHKPKRVEFITNASLNISPQKWLRVLKTHDVVGISLDACTPETYHLVRVSSNWTNVFKNIELIKALRKEHGLKFQLRFNFVVMKINLHEMFEFVEKALFEWGGDCACLMHVDGERNADRVVLDSQEWRTQYNRQMFKIHKLKNRLKDGNCINLLGYAYDDNGFVEGVPELPRDLSKAKKLPPPPAPPLSDQELAKKFFSECSYGEAGDVYARIYRTEPANIEALFLQADCRYRQGQAMITRLLLEELLEKAPEHQAARERLVQLDAPQKRAA